MTGIMIEKAKSKRIKYAVRVLLFCILIFISGSCKKEGDRGPQGTSGPAGNFFNALQGGFIQGTITGTRSDSTPFTMNFNNRYYTAPDCFAYDEFSDSYGLSVERFSSPDPVHSGSCGLLFGLASLTSTVSTTVYFFGTFYQDLGNDQKFEIYISASNNSSNITLTNLSYSPSTRILQGSFHFDISAGDNTTNYPATASGSFQSIVMKEYVTAVNPETHTNPIAQ